MSRVYDNWEKLVGAVLKREELRRIALSQSLSSSPSADFSPRFSSDYALENVPAASRISGKTFDPAAHSSHRGVQPIKFKEIKKAAKNFQPNMLLGQGGFGPVFKGWVDEHTLSASKSGFGMAVAVKKWRQESWQGFQVWLKEISYVSQLRHPNLVKLIGYCSGEDNLILVYEFMSKGSLSNHLFGKGHQSLSWATRIKVAIGAARALSFLHEREIKVIYQSFSCRNILLDREFNAKLSDFHLATDISAGQVASEYVKTGRVTAKCAVYGLGIILLELLSGRRVSDRNRIMAAKKQNLVDWAINLHERGNLMQIMDTKLEGQYPHDGAYTVAKLALQCLSLQPTLRPRMAEVLVALEQL